MNKPQPTRMTTTLMGLTLIGMLSACATNTNSQAVSGDARPFIGHVTQKQTIQQQRPYRNSPIDVNVGIGGGSGHIGWGVSVGLAQLLLNSAMNTPINSYRYTVQTNPNETYIIQTNDEFTVSECVTVWLRSNDATYPRIQPNSGCTLPR